MILRYAPGNATAQELSLAARILERAGNGSGTGENLVWTQQVAINRELLLGHDEIVEDLFAVMWKSVFVTASDGVQADWSFHFHGPLLYT